MDEGYCGARAPRLDVLLLTLFSTYHGIPRYSPILILLPFFSLRNIIQRREWIVNITCLVIPFYYFLLNSSYAYWHYRHCTACLPFLVLPLIVGWETKRVSSQRFTGASLFFGILAALSFVVCIARMHVRASRKSLALFREFADGNIHNLGNVCNLAKSIGRSSCVSLLILLVVWIVFGTLLIIAVRNAEQST
jgi:hypothetical protein